MSYTFREETVGSYPIRIEASNDDGTSVKEFVVEVVEKMPSEVRFEKLSHYCKTTDRSTFVGRAVYLAPSLAYVADPQFAWSVDGEPVVAETGAVFKFTPDGPGDYTVRVDVTEGGDASERLTRNIVRGVATLSAEIVVHAFADEEQRRRPASAASSRFQHAVYEFLPAPGQLVGEKPKPDIRAMSVPMKMPWLMQPGGWRRGVMFRSGIRRLSDRRVRPQYRPNGKRLRFFHSGECVRHQLGAGCGVGHAGRERQRRAR